MTSFTYPEYQPGQRVGRLIVVRRNVERNRRGNWEYLCRCDCGIEKLIERQRLIDGKAVSCGCAKSDAHQRWGSRYFGRHRRRVGGDS